MDWRRSAEEAVKVDLGALGVFSRSASVWAATKSRRECSCLSGGSVIARRALSRAGLRTYGGRASRGSVVGVSSWAMSELLADLVLFRGDCADRHLPSLPMLTKWS